MEKHEIDELAIKDLRAVYEYGRDSHYSSTRQGDNLIMWLVGLSAGVLAIIGKEGMFANEDRYILWFFVATIISGVVYRVIRYYLDRAQMTRVCKYVDDLAGAMRIASFSQEMAAYYHNRKNELRACFNDEATKNKIGPHTPLNSIWRNLSKYIKEGHIELLCKVFFIFTSFVFMLGVVFMACSLG